MRKKIRFIVNPISGVGRQKIIEGLVNKELDSQLFESEITYTEGPKHATQLAKEAAASNFDVVAAVGGDGSINEVGSGLLGSESALAIIPTGSGNGLARQLKIPMKLKNAITVINDFHTTVIDSGVANGHPFFVTAGVGFDAYIGWKFANRKTRGLGAYMKLVMREYKSYSAKPYELTVDGKSLQRSAFLICIANASQYGNNARIAPAASLNDGILDICILQKATLAQAPNLISQLFSGNLERSKNTEYIKGKEIILKQEGNYMHLDGEPLAIGTELKIMVKPDSLKVVVPK